MRKYFKLNKNDNITYQKLQDAVKAVFRENFTAINAYLKNKDSFESMI